MKAAIYNSYQIILGLILLQSLNFSCQIRKETNNSILQKSVLWKQGEGRYNNYRIPSVVVTNSGVVLAFCEGREGGDSGDIDLLMKRSDDHGLTWSEEQKIWDDGQNTCGNPCPVVDEDTGRIWLFSTWNFGQDHENEIIHKTSTSARLPYVMYSDDEGRSWSEPTALSPLCRDSSWGWYATGPGIGIQIKHGEYKGRLVIPANHSYDDPNGTIRNGPFGYGAHILYSDDHGGSWKMGQQIKPGCNESQVIELSDGSLLMNMRSYNDQYARAISISSDGGESWSEISHDYQLVESKCQASILNFGEFHGKHMQLFSNPAVAIGRTHLSVKVSFDDAATWSTTRLIYPGFSAYSCLTHLANGQVGIFFENGENHPYENMTFLSFDPGELFTRGRLCY